jgi:branched-chain amino acid aminotransferase
MTEITETTATPLVYVGGEFRPAADACVSVFDHGLLYGDGVFEGIRAYNGRVFKLERHIERLFESAKAIRLEIPLTPEEMAEVVLEGCRRNDLADAYIRLVVTRGPGDLSIDPRSCRRAVVVAIVRPAVALYAAKRATGVSVVTSALRRNAPDALSPAIKSLNYLNNVLARIEANDRGADEALLLDQNGYVAEATVDNVFIVTTHGLIAPPTSTNLNGITRETILELAREAGIATQERPFALFDVWTAREAFMCGTLAEIVPIATVDGRTIGAGGVGPTTARLVDAYSRHVRSTGTAIARTASLDAPRDRLIEAHA